MSQQWKWNLNNVPKKRENKRRHGAGQQRHRGNTGDLFIQRQWAANKSCCLVSLQHLYFFYILGSSLNNFPRHWCWLNHEIHQRAWPHMTVHRLVGCFVETCSFCAAGPYLFPHPSLPVDNTPWFPVNSPSSPAFSINVSQLSFSA